MNVNSKLDTSNVGSKPVFDPESTEGYALVLADPALQLTWQDRLDSVFAERIVDVRNALRDSGWEGEPRSRFLTRGALQVEFKPLQVGAGANVVGGSWRLLATNNLKLSLNSRTIAELPDVLSGSAAELTDQIDLMMIRETARISENGRRSPQELTFKEFCEIASVLKLENHGRQWSVGFGIKDLGFSDGPAVMDALHEVHGREVNNAIYSNSPDTSDFMKKAVFPPENVLAEYPELRRKFSVVFESRDLVERSQRIVEGIGGFVDEHSDWWESQLDRAGNKIAQGELQSWLTLLSSPGDPHYAAQSLSLFVGLVEGGRLDWLEASYQDCLENLLFAEAKDIVSKVQAKEIGANPHVGDVVREGSFSGQVLAVTVDGVMTQKVNRNGDTVQHALSLLSAPVAIGSVVEIKYAGGVGVVGGKALSTGVGR